MVHAFTVPSQSEARHGQEPGARLELDRLRTSRYGQTAAYPMTQRVWRGVAMLDRWCVLVEDERVAHNVANVFEHVFQRSCDSHGIMHRTVRV